MADTVDLIILGGGPIGAATAYFLSRAGSGQKVCLLSKDPSADNAAWQNAGGSVRWYWDDAEKRAMTKETADFAKRLVSEGVELSLLEDNYLFLHRGVFAPSINLSGGKLVDYLLAEAAKNGVDVRRSAEVTGITRDGETYKIATSAGEFAARKVLCAMGAAANTQLVDGYEVEPEERQLYVLDAAVTADSASLPHIILPIGEGVAYIFVKKTPNGLRFVVGQEDAIEPAGNADDFKALLAAGLGSIMPFLKQAGVETVWSGTDAGNKTLKLEEAQPGLWAANCGSAIRSCAYIGRTVAERLTQ